jgi:tetratricopeptide (TPR) repeat protein
MLLAPSVDELRSSMLVGRLSNDQFCTFWRRAAAQAHLRGNLKTLRILLELLHQAPAAQTQLGQLLDHQYTGILLLSEGVFDQALSHFQQQRLIAENDLDITEIALAQLDLAQANLYLLNLEEAQDCLQKAEYWAGTSPEPALLVKTLNRQAELAAYRHQTNQSIEKATGALNLARQSHLRLDQAQALNWLGINWMYRRKLEQAEEALREALRLYQTVRNPLGQAETLLNLARLQLKRENEVAANKAVDESLAIMKRLENRLGIAQALYHKTLVLYRSGQSRAALPWAVQAVEARKQQSEPTRQAQAVSLLAQIYSSLGREKEALACHLRVIHLHGPDHTTPQWIELLVNAGDYLLGSKAEQPGSQRYWQQAVQSYRYVIRFIESQENLNYLAPMLGRMARGLLKLGGMYEVPEAIRCYHLQLKLLGDIDSVFFPPEEAIAQRAEALTGLQVCTSLLRRYQS